MVIGPDPFDPAKETDAVRRASGDAGGMVCFTGLVRGEGDGVALELQHHPTFTQKVIAGMARAAAERWSLSALRVLHRTGRMGPGEAIVFVGAASRHRRDAFLAADSLMDDLKTRAPFWKREHRGGETRWIEPRPEDYSDAERWSETA